MSRKAIKVSRENFSIIQNLASGELITVKHKDRPGKVVLKVSDDDSK